MITRRKEPFQALPPDCDWTCRPGANEQLPMPRWNAIPWLLLGSLSVSCAFPGCATTKQPAAAMVRTSAAARGPRTVEAPGRVVSRVESLSPVPRPGSVVQTGYTRDAPGMPVSAITASSSTSEEGPAPPPDPSNETQSATPGVASDAAVDTSSAALPDSRQPHLIDLPLVMQLVDGQNPQVLYARERIQEALAKLDRAEVLWLPSLRAGVNWNKHEGRIQDVAGRVIDTSRGSYFTGFGADAVGAGSPRVPGLIAQFHLADAYFEPLIAQRAAHAREFGSRVATNDMLLDSSLAYLELLNARQELAIALETRENTRKLAELTATYARSGQGVAADEDRARAELAIRENDLQRGSEGVQVASARLAEKLNLDPGLRFEPREPVVAPIELQSVQQPVSELVAYSLIHRPEISESRSLAAEAVERLQREKYAPLVPSLLLGLSYGGLGGGFGSNFVNFGDRLDADIVAWWEVRNLGFGERAARCEAQSRVQQARYREVAALDRVAREVVEAHAQVESRRRQLSTAEEGIRAAQSSYDRNLERIRNVQGLPLEALQSIQALSQARREYLRVVISFNEAQLRLQRALGWPEENVAIRAGEMTE